MIKAEKLTKKFGKFTAVDALDLDIAPGEIFGFLGANGAGKTTTIRILSGLLRPSGGRAEVGGFDCYRNSEKVRSLIGYMSQRFSLYDDLRARENIDFFSSLYRVRTQTALTRLRPLLSLLGLEDKLGLVTRDLPVGFKQRLGLVCSLIHDPAVLFLDEPTSGVDPKARREFWDVINQLAGTGKTVIVSTHYMDEAEYCHRVIVMRSGREADTGSPSELKARHGVSSMQDLFLSLGAE
jgi:ABC-2 type transport system ATP-binding protein